VSAETLRAVDVDCVYVETDQIPRPGPAFVSKGWR